MLMSESSRYIDIYSRSIDTSNSTVTIYLQLKDGFLPEAEIADTGVLPSEQEGPRNKTDISQFLLDKGNIAGLGLKGLSCFPNLRHGSSLRG
ncbi:unnamed protein product [Brassica oleracea]